MDPQSPISPMLPLPSPSPSPSPLVQSSCRASSLPLSSPIVMPSLAASPLSPASSLVLSPLSDTSLLDLSPPPPTPPPSAPQGGFTPSRSPLITVESVQTTPAHDGPRDRSRSRRSTSRRVAARLRFESDDEDAVGQEYEQLTPHVVDSIVAPATATSTPAPVTPSLVSMSRQHTHVRQVSMSVQDLVEIGDPTALSPGALADMAVEEALSLSMVDVEFGSPRRPSVAASAAAAKHMHLSPLCPILPGQPHSPASPLSPLPGSMHPYTRYLSQQTHLLHPIPPAAASAASPSSFDLRSTLRGRRLADSMDALAPPGFMFLFLDRTIEEGENFLLYSYPSSPITRRLLGMRGVLSVLEGAVAAVTGQRAQVAVIEELTHELENAQDPPRRANAAGQRDAPLRVKACTRELSELGRGLAFVCLTWRPISDTALQTLTRNMLSSLRATIGPLHLGLFKPWLLHEATPQGKKKPFVLKDFWTQRPGHNDHTASEDHEYREHEPVWASELEAHASTEQPSAALLPSDVQWIARAAARAAQRASSPVVVAPIIDPPIAATVDASSPAALSPSSRSPHDTILTCSYEAMHLLDAFFRQATHTVCKDVMLDPRTPRVALGSFLLPNLVPQAAMALATASSTMARLTASFSLNIADEMARLLAAGAGDSIDSPAALGTVLFHRGELVHVAHPAARSSESPVDPLSIVLSPVLSTDSTSPPASTRGITGLRQCDVHEISNLLTLLGVFEPPATTSTSSPPPSASSAIAYAATHQIWLAYSAHELASSSPGSDGGLFSPLFPAPSPTSLSILSPLSSPTGDRDRPSSSPSGARTPGHLRGATTLAGWSPMPTPSGPSKTDSDTKLQGARPFPLAVPATIIPATAGPATTPDTRVYQPRLLSVLQIGDLVLALVLDAPSRRRAAAIQAEALRTVEEQKAAQQSSPDASTGATHAFYFACEAFRPRRMHETLERLSAIDRAPSSAAASSSSSSSGNARSVLARLAHCVSGSGSQDVPSGSPVSPPTPLPMPLHARSKSSASILSRPEPAPTPRTQGVIYESTLLDYGRGIIVRPGGGETAAQALPTTFVADYTAVCSRIHGVLRTFQSLYLNTAAPAPVPTPALAATSIMALASPPSHVRSSSFSHGGGGPAIGGALPLTAASASHVSREELGRGNHVYFRRHKTLETIRHAHEVGFRLTYPSGPSFWVRGRLLANASVVFVCCDDALPADVLETSFAQLQQP